MEMRFNNKAFAFSFMVFFIAIVMFAILHLNMNKNDYTKEDVFVESRINYMNQELVYFKKTYLPNVVSYSFYNTLDALLNYSYYGSHFQSLNQNYTRFKELVFEGMSTGNFDGVSQSLLHGDGSIEGSNKTVTNFLKEYETEFENNYKAEFEFNILDVNIYETKPYYMSVQMLVNWSVNPSDNVSSWSSVENIFVTIPILNLPEPEFLHHADISIPSRSVEYSLPDRDWSLENFITTINESYSTVFMEREHMYTIGNSFLKRFLNISQGSYENVTAFYSFDYDQDNNNLYDSSLYNNYSRLYGNSRALFSFDNSSVNGINIYDITDYENNGISNGAILKLNLDNTSCVLGDCFEFENLNDYIEINNFPEIKKDISVFAWVYINESTGGQQRIVGSENEYFSYWVNNNGQVVVKLDGANQKNEDYDEIIFDDVNISLKEWHNIGFTYDGNYTVLYVDGIRHFLERTSRGSDYYNGDLNGNSEKVIIGNWNSHDRALNGRVDEVGIFSRVLTDDEISKLFEERRVYQVDYSNSFQGEGLFFDGVDDYVDLGDSEVYDYNGDLISVEMWFKLFNTSGDSSIIDKGVAGLRGWGIHINNGKVELGLHGGGTAGTNINVINKTDYWYHIVVVGFDNNEPKVYVNSKEYDVNMYYGSWPSSNLATNDNLIIGKRSDNDLNYFNGIIDEIKIYERGLTQEEVYQNYYNYESFGKGCCNYLLMINPNKFGYNNSVYLNNISYSSKIFYDYYVRGIDYNLSLYNLTNVTKYQTDENFYNFVFDDCVQHAFSISEYQTENISMDLFKKKGVGNNTCSNFVKMGVY